MNVLRRAVELCAPIVKHFEGCHKRKPDGMIYPYMCPAGYPTQGWGIVVESMKVPPISPAEADRRLDAALPVYMAQAIKASPVLATTAPRLAAVTSFVFNLGAGRYRASTLRRRINAREWTEAAAEFDRWVRGGGRVLPGLVRRRKAERALFETG